VGKFKKAAADILKTASIPSVATLEFQIDWGTRLEVDLPELVNLNEVLSTLAIPSCFLPVCISNHLSFEMHNI